MMAPESIFWEALGKKNWKTEKISTAYVFT